MRDAALCFCRVHVCTVLQTRLLKGSCMQQLRAAGKQEQDEVKRTSCAAGRQRTKEF